jgi:hypothetical protein
MLKQVLLKFVVGVSIENLMMRIKKLLKFSDLGFGATNSP